MTNSRETLVDVALGKVSPDVVIAGGDLVNVLTHEIYPADVLIKGDRIAAVGDAGEYDLSDDCRVIDAADHYLVPGFMDPHFHVESSSITVTELAKLIVPRGVTMVAEDPHEIANVLGMRGIEQLFAEGRGVPLHFCLRVPGRVPPLDPDCDTSGASLSLEETRLLLDWPEAVCLAGDVNSELLLRKDRTHFEKIDYTLKKGMTVSGQCAGLSGKQMNAFIAAGPEDSHVSATVEEVLDILRHGLKALLTHRPSKLEPKDFAKLAELIQEHGLDTRNILLHTDDTHANQLAKEGHLEYRIRLAIENGFDPITAIQMATINVADFLRIARDYGSISPGKYADIVLLSDLERVKADKVFIHGKLVAEGGHLVEQPPEFQYPQWTRETMHLKAPVGADDLQIFAPGQEQVRARVAVPDTPKRIEIETLDVLNGVVHPDPPKGIASMAVVERHKATGSVGKGFWKYPMTAGAYASSVTHDSHNIFVVGVDFEDMALAVNQVAATQGGYVVVKDGQVLAQVELPIAGLLSEEPFETVAEKMEAVEKALREQLGCTIEYRPLYFLNLFSLPNVPNVGVTDKGLIASELMAPIDVVLQEGE